MKKTLQIVLVGMCLAIPAATQTAPQASPKDPMATWLRNSDTTIESNLRKTADKVPEELYGLRPGPQMEVRTFGQILGHLVNLNYRWCAQAKGEKNPIQATDFEKVTSKAALVQGLNEAFAYCDAVYAALTDASGLEVMTITQENGRENHTPRMAILMQNYAHNNEHYGNLVTYMRIKSIVPPSSEPRPQQPPAPAQH